MSKLLITSDKDSLFQTWYSPEARPFAITIYAIIKKTEEEKRRVYEMFPRKSPNPPVETPAEILGWCRSYVELVESGGLFDEFSHAPKYTPEQMAEILAKYRVCGVLCNDHIWDPEKQQEGIISEALKEAESARQYLEEIMQQDPTNQ